MVKYNYAEIEPIEFSVYPIWELQEDEDNEAFVKFQKYYLPGTKPSITHAWRRYVADEASNNILLGKGTDEDGNTNALAVKTQVPKGDQAGHAFKSWDKKYRWYERHRAYWQNRLQKELAWQEHQQREATSRAIAITNKLLQRAEEIASMPAFTVETTRLHPDGKPMIQVVTPQDSRRYVDALALVKETLNIANNLGCQQELDKAYQKVLNAGFEISDPTLLLPMPTQELEFEAD